MKSIVYHIHILKNKILIALLAKVHSGTWREKLLT